MSSGKVEMYASMSFGDGRFDSFMVLAFCGMKVGFLENLCNSGLGFLGLVICFKIRSLQKLKHATQRLYTIVSRVHFHLFILLRNDHFLSPALAIVIKAQQINSIGKCREVKLR